MPYSERTFLLLGIGITLIGVGWWVITHVSFEEETRLAPAVRQAPALGAESAVPEGSTDVPEGDAAPPAEEVNAAAEPAPPSAPESAAEPEAPSEPIHAPSVDAPSVDVPPQDFPLEPEDGAVTDEAAEGQSYPLPESSVTPPDAGRDLPIQMVPLRTAPAGASPEASSEGEALPEE